MRVAAANDGDQDLAVLTYNAIVLFSNDGSARFHKQSALDIGSATSMAAGDYDSDGDLDSNRSTPSATIARPSAYNPIGSPRSMGWSTSSRPTPTQPCGVPPKQSNWPSVPRI